MDIYDAIYIMLDALTETTDMTDIEIFEYLMEIENGNDN